MRVLLIKLKDGKIYKACVPLHFMVAEKHNLDLNDVIAVGFITRDREVWDDRKPH